MFPMDRHRYMIVWLLVFGLIGVLSEIGAEDAPGQAVQKSIPMKKTVDSKKLGITDKETRKNIPQHIREEQQESDHNEEREIELIRLQAQQAQRAREQAQRARDREMRGRVAPPNSPVDDHRRPVHRPVGDHRSPVHRPPSVRSY